MYEVAAAAGVSIATVSRVLRDSARVSEEKRQRVLEAASQFNYLPSGLARSLAEGRNAANGIVFPDLSGPYYAEVILGYEEAAAQVGHSVLILSTRGRGHLRDMVRDLAARVDGLVVFGRTVADSVVLEILAAGVPVVLLSRSPLPGADCIRTENVTAADELAGHLFGHRYESISFLGDPDGSADVADRWEGFARAVRARGAGLRHPLVCELDVESGAEAARHALRPSHRPRALFCANDEIALGAILAAEELGLRVPADVAVTGWDDIMAARYARPALTTVRQPMRAMGALAARTLHRRIGGDDSPFQPQVMPTELVLRSSCGCPPSPASSHL